MPLPIFHGTVHPVKDKTGFLYGVRQETLEAYLKAERKKVWEAAAKDMEDRYRNSFEYSINIEEHIAYCCEQAAKEML